jgi:prepilin-type N-terminal cleavage/methylation domain-containing protein
VRSRPRPRAGGFTLLELLIALALIGLVAALAIPAFFERGEVTLDNASRLLAEDLRAAQNRAAYLELDVRVVFREDGDGYSVVGPDGALLEAPGHDGRFERRYAGYGVFDGVRVQSVDMPERTMVYDEDGLAPRGGRVVLGYRDDARLIEVGPGDGLIHVPGLARPWIDTGY